MTDIGRLRVSLEMQAASFNEAVQRASAQSKRLGGDLTELGRKAQAGGTGFQNVAFQVQDFFVQIQAGTSVTQALSQQLPQLLGGFGLAGAAMGAAIPIAAMLGQRFLGIGSAAEDADESMEAFRTSAADLKGSLDILGMSLVDLREKYGETAEFIRNTTLTDVPQEAAKAAADAITAIEGQRTAVQGLIDTYEDLIEAQAFLERTEATGVQSSIDAARGEVSVLVEEFMAAEETLGMTVDQAKDLAAAFDAVDKNAPLDEVNARARDLIGAIDEIFAGVEKLPDLADAMRDAMEEVVGTTAEAATQADQVGASIGSAADEAERLARHMESSLGAYHQYQQSRALGQREGMSGGGSLVDRIIGVESGGNASARNPSSSATGLGQFIESTWISLFEEHFPDRAAGMTDAAILALREDAATSRAMVDLYLQDNAKLLAQAGVAVTDANLYLSHFLGPQGAIGVLRDIDAQLADTVAAASIAANPSILGGGRTGRDLLAWAQGKVGVSEAELGVMEAEQAAAVREQAEAERELTQERERAAREAESLADQAARYAARELGFREDLLAASDRAAQGAEFELSLVGRSVAEQARLRVAHDLTNQALANGIDLNELVAGTTQTYGQRIDEAAAAAGRAAAQQEALAVAEDAAADAAANAAAEMQRFVSSMTSRALGPITSNPIGGFLADLPGFGAGAESAIGGFLSGGFSGAGSAISTALSGATTGLAGLGTAIGSIAAPVGAAIGLFQGLKGTTETLDAGLRVTLDGMDALVEEFETTRRTFLFGLARQTSTDYDQAGAEIAGPIQRAYSGITDRILDLADRIGVGAARFRGFSTSFQLSLDGMSDEQRIAAVEERFGAVSDQLARMAGAAARFGEEGDSSTQVLERMAANLGAVNEALRGMGVHVLGVSEKGARAASVMVEAAGGLDAFTSAAEVFLAEFYSVEEQARAARRSFDRGLREIGVDRTFASMDEFRGFVEQLQRAGRETKAGALLALADEFAEWQDLLARSQQEAADAAEEAARRMEAVADERDGLMRRFYELTDNRAMLDAMELEGLDATNRAFGRYIQDLERAKELYEDSRPSDFATRLDFERNVGLAANLLRAPPSDPALAGIRQTIADMDKRLTQLLLSIEQNTFTQAATTKKWDTIGQPPTQAA